jgi:hypothetical protein
MIILNQLGTVYATRHQPQEKTQTACEGVVRSSKTVPLGSDLSGQLAISCKNRVTDGTKTTMVIAQNSQCGTELFANCLVHKESEL